MEDPLVHGELMYHIAKTKSRHMKKNTSQNGAMASKEEGFKGKISDELIAVDAFDILHNGSMERYCMLVCPNCP